MSFPVDSVTLEMLLKSLHTYDKKGRSTFDQFLFMMSLLEDGGVSREKVQTYTLDGVPVEEYKYDACDYSTSDVIEALATEILRMRENL